MFLRIDMHILVLSHHKSCSKSNFGSNLFVLLSLTSHDGQEIMQEEKEKKIKADGGILENPKTKAIGQVDATFF